MATDGNNTKTQATEATVKPLDPWFHYSGDYANAVIRKDGNGIALAVSTEVAKDDLPESYCKRYIFRHSKDKHCCIVCGELKSVKENKITNMVSHIINQHYDRAVLMRKNVPDSFNMQKQKEWKDAEKIRDEGIQPTRSSSSSSNCRPRIQMTMATAGAYNVRSIEDQKAMLVKAICLGSLPLTTLHNKGKNNFHAISYAYYMSCGKIIDFSVYIFMK